ncbi:helix-turn-helix domain-containing protein [Jatrophihabitans cynanchi]|uniref:Helix-turn-helix domain-containing protein n=1 Tax=Jatrophihabitans cynanchi TaxID=2944128 RepID=A0ABY7K3H3_9ACTN|nr:helix-turn-helix domain-containing protein [Jatrophihabitans sp. SB3-54]WAX58545.1 helix-turn-helix domain-containing protein [Jatrophihabitans sp. SB3-54]
MTTIDHDEAPIAVDLLTAARMLGIGRTMAYRLVREGQWPTPLLRIGKLIRVPMDPLRELLRQGSEATSSSVARTATGSARLHR